jgi:transcriptional regulator with XRE-family HTH domain
MADRETLLSPAAPESDAPSVVYDRTSGDATEAVVSEVMGLFLRSRRRARDLTQEQLAAKVGVSHNRISRIESGTTATLGEVMRIADVLGISCLGIGLFLGNLSEKLKSLPKERRESNAELARACAPPEDVLAAEMASR